MKFDDADWHAGSDGFPSELPFEAGATHIGMFVAWAVHSGLAGGLLEDIPDQIGWLLRREMSPGEFVADCCDFQLAADMLDADGERFANAYYDQFGNDYARALKTQSLASFYGVPDSWETYDRIAPVLDRRFRDWAERNGVSTGPRPTLAASDRTRAEVQAAQPEFQEAVFVHEAAPVEQDAALLKVWFSEQRIGLHESRVESPELRAWIAAMRAAFPRVELDVGPTTAVAVLRDPPDHASFRTHEIHLETKVGCFQPNRPDSDVYWPYAPGRWKGWPKPRPS